jgi:hypothetical protein
VRIAVIIPFRGDAGTLLWALEGFALQRMPAGWELEVRVCGDGVELPALPEGTSRMSFFGVVSERVGISEAKNVLLRERPCDVVIFANADTRPVEEFVRVHVEKLMGLEAGSMVLGSSPYEVGAAGRTVFDVLKEETPMIFFYGNLEAGKGYDFRHAWNLNVSVRYADVERAGFFNPLLRPYGFEDLDLAYRMMGERRGVYFEPGAKVMHRHPMTFEQYLDREELLGVMSPVLHGANRVVFGKLHGAEDLELLAGRFRAWVEMDAAMHGWIYRRMEEWNGLPEGVLGEGKERERVMMGLYQMHVPLKRLAFRLGFLRGMELSGNGRWMERKAVGVWRKVIGV